MDSFWYTSCDSLNTWELHGTALYLLAPNEKELNFSNPKPFDEWTIYYFTQCWTPATTSRKLSRFWGSPAGVYDDSMEPRNGFLPFFCPWCFIHLTSRKLTCPIQSGKWVSLPIGGGYVSSLARIYMGGFLKWWVSPTTIGFPTKNDHFEVFWGYHHLRKHPYLRI